MYIQFVDIVLEAILFLNLQSQFCLYVLVHGCYNLHVYISFIFAYTCMVMYINVSPFFCSQYCIYFVPSIKKTIPKTTQTLACFIFIFSF